MWLFITPDSNANENKMQKILLTATGGDNIAMIYNASQISSEGCQVFIITLCVTFLHYIPVERNTLFS